MHRAVYIFILAWDEVIRAHQTAVTSPQDGDNQATSPNNEEFLFILPRGDMLPPDFWDDEQLSLKEMLNNAKTFLSERLIFNSEGEVLSHRLLTKERKNKYPIQTDIVEYLKTTEYVSNEYQEVSIQSSVSHVLDNLRGVDKKSSKTDRVALTGLIVCVNREYKPFSAQEKRNEIILSVDKDLANIEKYGVKKFAKLTKDIIYDIGKGGIILFFEEDAKLDETQDFLKKFIGEQYLCDMFEIKGRLFVLLGGREEDFSTTTDCLDDLVKAIYRGQNKRSKINIKRISKKKNYEN